MSLEKEINDLKKIGGVFRSLRTIYRVAVCNKPPENGSPVVIKLVSEAYESCLNEVILPMNEIQLKVYIGAQKTIYGAVTVIDMRFSYVNIHPLNEIDPNPKKEKRFDSISNYQLERMKK